jgi:cyclase
MVKRRIIPVVLLRNGVIVQSRLFRRYQALGSPTAVVERLGSWASDELVYLDISPAGQFEPQRGDLNRPGLQDIHEVIRCVAARCHMPLTFGGGIRSVEDARARVLAGADKITLNSAALDDPGLITACAREFGAQAVVVSIDVRREGGRAVVHRGGRTATDRDARGWARQAEGHGAGEILLNSMDRDGTGIGFDVELIAEVCDAVSVPVVALGGAGAPEHFAEVLERTRASAVAAANLFQHSENSVYRVKRWLFERGFDVRRPPELSDARSLL